VHHLIPLLAICNSASHHIQQKDQIFLVAITYGKSKHPKHSEKEKNASLITMTTAVSYAKVV
jgi:hypothetical protein